jgi:hypothetical protein
MTRSRERVFALLVVACVLAAGGYVTFAATRGGPGAGTGDETEAAAPGAPRAALPTGPGAVVYQHVVRDEDYAHVAILAGGKRTVAPLVCERVYAAAGRGLCLTGEDGLTGPRFEVKEFDSGFRVRHEITMSGLLSRARISADGRYGAATGFVTGHSYADGNQFSTTTWLIDMESGRKLADLEKLRVTRDGVAETAQDRNFWGVTFSAADSDRFYATMRTGDKTYLIEGSVSGRSARTLHENVECPSLSPDGTRVAYKKRVDDGSVIWRLHVLDLRTMRDTALAETRMVDDQAEWLDDDTVLYGLEGSIWAVPADGSGAPRKYIDGGLSPAVSR